MGIIDRGLSVDKFFRRRSFVIDSPDVRSERLPDGRVQLHARRRPIVVATPAVPLFRKIYTVTLGGYTEPDGVPAQRIEFAPFTWTRIPDSHDITRVDVFKRHTTPPPYFESVFEVGEFYQDVGFQINPSGLFRLWAYDDYVPTDKWDYLFLAIADGEDAASCDLIIKRGSGGFEVGPGIDISLGDFDLTHTVLGTTVSYTVHLEWAMLP